MKLFLAASAVILLVIGIGLGVGYLGFSNDANGFEVDIKAKYTNNKNVYDNGWKKVKESAQVTDLQADALKKVYDSTMKGRYGDGGSKALLQMIKEQNPNLDQSTFLKLQQQIESFRNEFSSNQTGLISRKQEYERYLTATTAGRLFNFIGHYPHIDLSQFDIVTSDQTEDAFKSKRADPISLK